MNGLQGGTPYAERPVGNIRGLMPLNNSISRYIVHSLHFNFVLGRFVLKGKGNDEGGNK